MKIVEMRCPRCDSMLKVETDRKVFFCQYCGTQVLVDDGTQKVEYTYREIDEARMQESADEKEFRIEEMRYKDRENERDNKQFKFIFIIWFLLILACFGMTLLMTNMSSCNRKRSLEQGMISAGNTSDYIKKKYSAAESLLEAKGFTNIELIDLDDAGLFTNKKDTVESVTIDGTSSFSEDDYFYPTAHVIIAYH